MPTPKVYLIGAGPGDPGLLTLRGQECLAEADFVLYDQLVSPQILRHAPPHAERMCVRDLASTHPDRWPQIHVKLIEEARKGKCAVRLKGGDPLIFGRGGEEAEALREAGIPYEIVPGVTAALAAGAYLEIPLTHRVHASAIAFVTGHEHPGKPSSKIDWQAIANFPGTLVIYMGFSRLGAIVPELIRCGKSPDTPAAAVTRASCGEQHSVTSTLGQLEDDIRAAGLTTPALVIIGPVVALRPKLSWFERLPLLGQRILLTRPHHQALEMTHQLELLGAIPLTLPAIEIRPPHSWAPVDDALDTLGRGGYDWLVFTSANGVTMFLDRLRSLGKDARLLGTVKIAVVGTATAAKLQTYFLKADLSPEQAMNSEGLAEELKRHVAGKRVLLAQADRGRELLCEQLGPICTLDRIAVYAQVESIDAGDPAFDRLRRGEIDCVLLTSPNIARAFLGACDETIRDRMRKSVTRLISNSPRTSQAIREFGIDPAVESRDPTADALIDALTAQEPRTK